jgi:glycosyltransferase involved in cell wall biosynthesis
MSEDHAAWQEGGSALTVCADRRWPPNTGIGVVQYELERRRPAGTEIVDLGVKGRIGAIFSPVSISRAIRKMKLPKDVMFISWGFIPPLISRRKKILIVHDLTHLHYYGWLKKTYYNVIFKPLYRRCAAISCVSKFTRDEFVAWSGMQPAKVHVIYNGCSQDFSQDAMPANLGYRYLLYPGNHRVYKNLGRLIQGYAHSGLSRDGVHLVLTGSENDQLLAVAAQEGVSDFVHFLGTVPHPEIPKLYRGASAIAFISLYEGFGLPIVEGMASGVPVVTSNLSCMPEIADGAAMLVDPFDVADIARGLTSVVHDDGVRNRLIARGLERVKCFNWDEAGGKFWTLAKQVAML